MNFSLTAKTKLNILRDYEVIELLGDGSMGEVFKVRNRNVDRIEALKMLKTDNHEFLENTKDRFKREITTVAAIKNEFPHVLIPQIFNCQYSEDRFFYTMEFVEGTTLSKLIAKKNITPQRAVEIAIELTQTLEIIHGKNILHRDIKPDNIVIDKKGKVWLLDFGILKESKNKSMQVKPNLLVGTPRYMSPEQVSNKQMGIPSELYSLGTVFYEMLAFESFAKSKKLEEIFDEMFSQKKPPVAPSKISKNVSPKTDAICLKLLNVDKDERYQNAAQLRQDLTNSLKKPSFSKERILNIVLLLILLYKFLF